MEFLNDSTSDIFDNFIEILNEQKSIAIKSNDNNAEIIASQITKKLSDFINSINYSINQDNLNLNNNSLYDLEYVLVALSDEVFLNLQWKGNEFWKSNLLETKFSKTQSAGDTIFDKIDMILNRKNFLSVENAIIYLKLLALGFQGKYRNTNSYQKINDYKHKLYLFITSNTSGINPGDMIFPDGYKYTLTGLPKIFTPNEYSIDHIFYTIIVLFVIGTGIFWEYEHIKLQEVINLLDSTNGDKNE